MIIIDDNDMRHLFHASTWVNTTPCQMNRKKSAVLFYIHMFLELQGCTYLELGDLFICLSKFTLSCVYVVLSFVFLLESVPHIHKYPFQHQYQSGGSISEPCHDMLKKQLVGCFAIYPRRHADMHL